MRTLYAFRNHTASVLNAMFGSYRRAYGLFFAIVLFHFLIAVAIMPRSLAQFFEISRALDWLGIALVPIATLAAWVATLCIRRHYEHPTATILRYMWRNRIWALRSTLVFAAISGPASFAFMSIKVAIPHLVDFYADPALSQIDRWLMLGHDPWQLSHALFGPLATRAIDIAYSLWFVALTAISLWVSFDRNQKFQIRSALAYMLTWILLGNGLAIALSSVGPIFYQDYYGDPVFAKLLEQLEAAPNVLLIREYLLDNVGKQVLGSGISAAPSLHVAITFLLFLMVRARFGKGWLSALTFSYAMVIWLGSVHLAWHYVIDGLLAIALTLPIWLISGSIVNRLQSERPQSP